jgi:photosystem II stability/assembly factor-like uncharacterized protein
MANKRSIWRLGIFLHKYGKHNLSRNQQWSICILRQWVNLDSCEHRNRNYSCISLTVQGTTLFAGTSNGVYASSDNGAHWIQKNTGFKNLNITALNTKSTTLFAGASDAVYISNDNGDHWTMANTGIPATYNVYNFAVYSTTVFAGTYGNGLYKTDNNGTSWTKVLGGLADNAFIYSVRVNGTDIFAGTNSGVYKSTDGGTTWTLSNTGFTNADAHAQDFAFTTGAILAGTYSEGVFRSTDNGATWAPVNNGLPNYTFNSGLPHNYPRTQAMIASGNNVLDGTAKGVFLTSDKGNTWVSSSTGLANTKVLSLTGNSTAEFAGTDGDGIFSSSDNGMTWVPKSNGLLSFNITSLGKKLETIFAGTADQGIFSSDDNGTTWKPITGTSGSAHAFLAKGTSVFAGVAPNGPYFPGEIYRLTNPGSGYTATALNFPHPVLSLALKGDSIFAGTNDGKIYASANDGASWTDMSTGLSTSPVSSIVLLNKVLYASTSGSGVYKSLNNGATWTSTGNLGLTDMYVNDLKFQSNTLFAGTQNKGVFRSDDGGAHWTDQNGNLKYLTINALDIRGTNLFAGTSGAVWFRNSGVVTGLTEFTMNNNTMVYPNPATDQLTIEVVKGSNTKISIVDMNGHLVFSDLQSGNTAGFKTELNVSNYNKGLYLLKIENGNEVTLKKFILQ